MKKIVATGLSLIMMFGICGISHAKNDKEKSLPPGLQKKSERGQSLPPGWQKKLVVGNVLEDDIYEHGRIIATDRDGLVTIRIEDRLIRLIKDTREIVEILEGM
jgi:hypothetical protein